MNQAPSEAERRRDLQQRVIDAVQRFNTARSKLVNGLTVQRHLDSIAYLKSDRDLLMQKQSRIQIEVNRLGEEINCEMVLLSKLTSVPKLGELCRDLSEYYSKDNPFPPRVCETTEQKDTNG